jgi:hypothetical protein
MGCVNCPFHDLRTTPVTRTTTRGLAAGLMILACTANEPCACPPAITSARLSGVALGLDSLPHPGVYASLRASFGPSPVEAGQVCPDSTLHSVYLDQSVTDSLGRFGGVLESAWSPTVHCLRLTLTAPGGDRVVLDTLSLRFVHNQALPDLQLSVIVP